ncbi:MAG: alpha/beta fold hydrolase [Actinomycetota bacterium]
MVTTASTSGTADNDGVGIHWVLDRPSDLRPGSERPLLLINGLGSPLVAFEPGFVALLVDRGLSVARFDNRDTGRSDRVERGPDGQSTPYTIADMAADAVAVLDAVGWTGANVVGQSMGGMIAQQLAIDHPDRVRSLVPFMTSSGEPGVGRSTEAAAEALLQPAPPERQAWLDHRVATERVWASPAHWSEALVLAKAEALWDHGIDHRGTFRQFRAIRAAGRRDVALARLTVPTLVLHGSADTLITPDGGRHLADVIPGAGYHEIVGLGHDLPPGLWDEIAGRIADFVDQVEAAP